MRSRLAILVALLSPAALTAADPVATFGGTTHFRTARLGTIVDLTFTPDGKTIIAGHVQRLGLTAWDAATGNQKWAAELNRVATADDGLRLVTPFHVLAVGGDVLTVEAADEKRWQIARFDAATGRRKEPTPLPFDTHPREFRFSADGKLLAYHEGLKCRIADVTTGKERTSINVNCHYLLKRSVAFSPDGKTIALYTGDDFIDTHDTTTGVFVARFALPAIHSMFGTWSPQYSRDGKWLLAQRDEVGREGGYLFDAATRARTDQPLMGLSGWPLFAPTHDAILTTETLPVGGSRLAAADFPVLATTPKVRWKLETPRPVRQLAYSPDGKVIAAASTNAVTLFDAASGDRLPQSADRVGGFALVQSAGGQFVTAADDLEAWDARTGERRHVLPAPTARGRWAALAPNGRYAVWEALTATGATLEVWDRVAGKRTAGPLERDERSYLAGVTADGRALLIGPDSPLQSYVLRMATSEEPARFKTLSSGLDGSLLLTAVGPSVDGRTIVAYRCAPAVSSASPSERTVTWSNQLHWLDATVRKFGETVPFIDDAPSAHVVSSDGRFAALTDSSSARDTSGRVVRIAHGVKLFAVKPGDGQQPLFRFPVASRPRTMAFSPDGRTLAAVHEGSAGYRVALYETCSGLLRGTFALPDAGQGLAFTPDGTHLAVVVADGPGVVFDVWKANDSFDLSKAWETLLSSDGERAFAAIQALAANPAVGVRLLRDRVAAAPAFAAADLAKLVTALDAPAFADREAASKQLRELVMDYRPVLQAELDRTPSAEVRERLEALLKQTDAAGGQTLRQFRAVEVLARIGTPEARAVLAAVADGDPGRRLNATAKAALGK